VALTRLGKKLHASRGGRGGGEERRRRRRRMRGR